MTLRELMNRVDEAAWREQVPTLVGLMEMKSPVAAIEKMGEEIVVTAFQNGYVVYQNGEHATVVMVKHFCNIYGSKNAEWLSLVYWDCLVYPAIRASYGVRYPL